MIIVIRVWRYSFRRLTSGSGVDSRRLRFESIFVPLMLELSSSSSQNLIDNDDDDLPER